MLKLSTLETNVFNARMDRPPGGERVDIQRGLRSRSPCRGAC